MGFTVTDSWTTSRWDKTLNILHVSIGSLIPTAITNHVPEFTKRPILLFTSAAINFGLFYTIMTHATIAPDTIKDLTNHSQNKLIAIFDLSNPELEPPVKNSPPVQQTRDQKDTQIPTPLDITPSIIPPEWSVSSITIANSNANDIGESNINSGNGTYDPYAGASPQREQKILSEDQSDTNMNIDYTGIDSTLDRAMFEEWVMKLRKRLSRANEIRL